MREVYLKCPKCSYESDHFIKRCHIVSEDYLNVVFQCRECSQEFHLTTALSQVLKALVAK